MVYVRVIEDARPVTGKMLFPVKVQAGPTSVVTVLSNKLYSFAAGEEGAVQDYGPTKSNLSLQSQARLAKEEPIPQDITSKPGMPEPKVTHNRG